MVECVRVRGMEIGKLAQYKSEFAGRYYQTCPKKPWSDNEWAHLPSLFEKGVNWMAKPLKCVMLVTDKVERPHPLVKTLPGCIYYRCLITMPDGDPKIIWVMDRWIEEYKTPSYEGDILQNMKAAYERLYPRK